MGEMIVRLEEVLIVELEARARVLRTKPEQLVADLVRQALDPRPRDRAAVARALQASQTPRPDLDGAELIRRDRDAR